MPEGDLDSIAETARDLAYRQLDEQFQAGDNLDMKSVGLLGFAGAGLAGVLAARDTFHGGTPVLFVFLLLSAYLAGAVINAREWDLGPDPGAFYEDATKNGVDAGSAAKANLALVAELRLSLGKNDRVLKRKSGHFSNALRVAGATAVLAGLVILVYNL